MQEENWEIYQKNLFERILDELKRDEKDEMQKVLGEIGKISEQEKTRKRCIRKYKRDSMEGGSWREIC